MSVKKNAQKGTKRVEKATKSTTSNRKKYANFRVFELTHTGWVLKSSPKLELNNEGQPVDSGALTALQQLDAMKNAEVSSLDVIAKNLLDPRVLKGSIFTEEMIPEIFRLAVEEGKDPGAIIFDIFLKYQIQSSPEQVKNVLKGRTYGSVNVPNKLREKYAVSQARAVADNGGTAPKSGLATDSRVQIVIRKDGGASGSEAMKGLCDSSSTANTVYRMVLGQYVSGREVPETKLPPYVKGVREELKKLAEAGEFNPTPILAKAIGFVKK